MITPPAAITPPRATDFPVVKGRIQSAKGYLGAFDIVVDDYAVPEPSSRGSLRFGAARNGAKSRCDILLDISGGASLFPAADLRDGYLRADPGDPAAVLRAALKARDLTGTFDKPRYITFTEDYPKYFGADFDIEVVLVVELFAELIREGRLTPRVPSERAITYHDPCRLNKRKGIWKEPREILRSIPGLDFTDVDRVTQWSYCSGGGGGLPVEKPELTAAISAGRLEKAAALEVDTLVSACPWSERPLSEAGEAANIDVVDIHELLAESLGIEVGGSRGGSSEGRQA
jgi:hypothetical protein